jgi:hypothetical protein
MSEDIVSIEAVDKYLEEMTYPKFLWVSKKEKPRFKGLSYIYSSPDIMDLEVFGYKNSPEINWINLIGAKQLYPSLLKDIHSLDDYNKGNDDRRWTIDEEQYEPHNLSQTSDYPQETKLGLTSFVRYDGHKDGKKVFERLRVEIDDMITYQNRFPELMRTDFSPKVS